MLNCWCQQALSDAFQWRSILDLLSSTSLHVLLNLRRETPFSTRFGWFAETAKMNGSQSTNHRNQTDIIPDAVMRPLWLCCEMTSAVLTVLSVYIATVLIIYTRKQNVRRASRGNSSLARSTSLADSFHKSVNETASPKHSEVNCLDAGPKRVPYMEQASVDSTKSHSHLMQSTSMELQEYTSTPRIPVQRLKERARGTWLLRALVVCAIVVVLRCVVEQCLLLMGDMEDPICDYLAKAMIASTAVSLHCCHVFLWLRQLTFYSNPVLKSLRSRKLKALSYSAYAIMPITLAASLVLFMIWRDYESVEGVCLPSTVNLSTYVPFGVLVASTVTIQIMLSSLFLYPLLTHRRKRKVYDTKKSKPRKDSTGSTSSSAGGTKRKRAKRDKLMDCIRRVFYGATIGITTDVIGGILSIFIPNYIPMFAYSVLYNLNVWLNVLCLIYTYANWRQMIFPWCCTSKPSRKFQDARSFSRASIRSERTRQSFNSRRNNSRSRPIRPMSVNC